MSGEAEEASRRSLSPGLRVEKSRGSSRALSASRVGECKPHTVSHTLCFAPVFPRSNRCGADQHLSHIVLQCTCGGKPSTGFQQRKPHQRWSLTKREDLGEPPLVAEPLICEVWKKHLGGVSEIWVPWRSIRILG